MAAIVSTCCCEDDDGGGGGDDPSDFKICCEDPPEKLTISVSTVYEMQNNRSLSQRQSCCPGVDCSGPGFCGGEWWNGQTSGSMSQLINGTIEIDLATFESTMTSGASSFVERGDCNWSCSLPCAYANCPCANSMNYQNDGTDTPNFTAEISRWNFGVRNFRCTGETIYPGDCLVTLTLASGFTGDFNYETNTPCNDGSQSDAVPPEDQVYSRSFYAKVAYRIYERNGSCEISDVPCITEMSWGPAADTSLNWYQGAGLGTRLADVWFDTYGNYNLPGYQNPTFDGGSCVGNGFPNSSWSISYDLGSSGVDSCTHPSVNDYFIMTRQGNWSCTTAFDSSAVFS
tara:strand:+ start:252 stop:1280 length:1029 start_codon:yes stop_codon:yes gene_type:complete